jgi:hypothetical protein
MRGMAEILRLRQYTHNVDAVAGADARAKLAFPKLTSPEFKLLGTTHPKH